MVERFWENIWITENCWLWLGAYRCKYGVIVDDNHKSIYVHRASWIIHNGPIPDGLKVLHKCDNTSCVRPSDLFLGTLADNSADMVAKGRSCRGERSHTAKATEAIVQEIRTCGLTQAEIVRRFGLCQNTISSILLRHTWKHVT